MVPNRQCRRLCLTTRYRLIVELPGVSSPQEALSLVGQAALLDFRLFDQTCRKNPSVKTQPPAQNRDSTSRDRIDGPAINGPVDFDLTRRAGGTGSEEGREIFAQVTSDHTGEMLGIFLDGSLLMAPTINTPIVDGRATITGGFTIDEAKQLSIQLNAGALPVPIEVLEQRTIGASLGQDSVEKSLMAGLVGLGLVMLFMILYYGVKGILASMALIVYAILTIAIYKTMGVTLTLPGIAGLILSIGMAVDANILIFERMKEELRVGKPFAVAMELGFGRAWDSIKMQIWPLSYR